MALAGDADHDLGRHALGAHPRGAARGALRDPDGRAAGDLDLNRAVDALKQRLIVQALRETGSKTRAAERLGHPAPVASEDDEAARPQDGRWSRGPRLAQPLQLRSQAHAVRTTVSRSE